MNDTPAVNHTPNAVKATISGNYRWRLGIIGIGFTLFGLWCLKDGFITYPQNQKIWVEYQRHTDEGRLSAWPAYAEERGWSIDAPKQVTDMSIYTQFIMAAIVFPIGFIFAVGFLRSFNRFVALEGSELYTRSGVRCRLDQVTGMDTRRWKTKGIAVVEFKDDAGVARTITLDDWKFDRTATTQIYQRVAQHLGIADEQPAQSEPTPANG
jgi:hypothetical protein